MKTKLKKFKEELMWREYSYLHELLKDVENSLDKMGIIYRKIETKSPLNKEIAGFFYITGEGLGVELSIHYSWLIDDGIQQQGYAIENIIEWEE